MEMRLAELDGKRSKQGTKFQIESLDDVSSPKMPETEISEKDRSYKATETAVPDGSSMRQRKKRRMTTGW